MSVSPWLTTLLLLRSRIAGAIIRWRHTCTHKAWAPQIGSTGAPGNHVHVPTSPPQLLSALLFFVPDWTLTFEYSSWFTLRLLALNLTSYFYTDFALGFVHIASSSRFKVWLCPFTLVLAAHASPLTQGSNVASPTQDKTAPCIDFHHLFRNRVSLLQKISSQNLSGCFQVHLRCHLEWFQQ